MTLSASEVPSHRVPRQWRRRTCQHRLVAALTWGSLICGALTTLTYSVASESDRDAVVSRIPRQPIESSAIRTIGYSRRLRVLEIEFKRGGTYRYLDVPPSVYRDLLAAESKARFYNWHVRGRYRAVHVRIVR